MTRNLFLGGVVVILVSAVVGLAGIITDENAWWQAGTLGVLLGMAATAVASAIVQRAIKRDSAMVRDRTFRISKRTQQMAPATKRTDHAISSGALSYLPGQIARIEQAATRTDRNVEDASGQLESLRAETRSLHELGLTNTIENRQEMRRTFDSLSASIAGLAAGENSVYEILRHSFDDHYRQIESLLALGDLLRDVHPLPPLRGWAASPDLARFLVEHILESQPAHILEIGSGTSTVLMAAAARANGTGHVTAIEHLSRYADQTGNAIAQAGLEDWATVIETELVERDIAGEPWTWYAVDIEALPASIDLLLVDGPPQSTGSNARYPAVPLLYQSLAEDARVILDDFKRPQEAAVAEMWLDRYPALTLTKLEHEKGTAVLTKPASTAEVED